VSEAVRVDIIISPTPAAERCEPEVLDLCRRAVRETLEREARRLAGLSAGARRGVTGAVPDPDSGTGTGRGAGPGTGPDAEPAAGSPAVELSLTLTGDEAIRNLNRRYLDQDRATDVLAFPLHEWEGSTFVLGDVVVSLDRAHRQAGELDLSPLEELARLVVHGTLHLLDYTDETQDSAALMHSKEDGVLRALGFSARWG